jgi:hypothetical protein
LNDDWVDPELARAQKREAKTAKAKAAQDDSVVQSIMASVGGRAWMLDQMEFCTVFHTTFTGEALGSAFNEGRRTVGLRMLAGIMRAAPGAYIQMMKEQNDVRSPSLDRSDRDDDANYDASGRWIGDGEE